MEFKDYFCPICKTPFKSMKKNENAIVRCPNCGNMKVKLKEEIKAEAASYIPKKSYTCINCTKKFEFEFRKDVTPTCPKCGSVELFEDKASVPSVRFLTRPDAIPLSKREIKKLRWIKRAFENLITFQDTKDSVLALMGRLQCNPKRIKLMTQQFDITLRELDAEHKKLLEAYNEN